MFNVEKKVLCPTRDFTTGLQSIGKKILVKSNNSGKNGI
jgi:hypothetical protein